LPLKKMCILARYNNTLKIRLFSEKEQSINKETTHKQTSVP